MTEGVTNAAIVAMYRNAYKPPQDGSLTAAIRKHAQACGLVAYVLDVHPDTVARAVAEVAEARYGPQ